MQMSNPIHFSSFRRLTITVAATALVGLGAVSSGVQAAPGIGQPDTEAPLILAATDGMERRDDNRDARQEDRGDRNDNRQDCRQEEGAVGGDKRDCKQDGRDNEGGTSDTGDKS
jgi:hypothetical protein